MLSEKTLVPKPVQDFLCEKRVAIIGGDSRPEQIKRLRFAFPTSEFVWFTTSESDPSTWRIESLLTQQQFDIVMLLMLSRHSHTKAVRSCCSSSGVPLLWCARPTVAAIVREVQEYLEIRGKRDRGNQS